MKVRRMILSVLIALVLTVSTILTGCGSAYPPKRSSLRDRKVVARVGDEHVTWELYRAFFYACRDRLDGGDRHYWEEDGDARRQALSDRVDAELCTLWAVFMLAEDCGIQTDGEEVMKRVEEWVTVDIEGGEYNGGHAVGYGTREEYLKALEKMHLTDAVNRLLYRKQACLEALTDYYRTTFAGGTVSQDEETVSEFYQSDECLHFLWICRSKADSYARALIEEDASLLSACGTYEERLSLIRRRSITLSVADLTNGIYMTRIASDSPYEKVIRAAETTPVGDVSGIVETSDAYYLLLAMPKDENYLKTPSGFTEIADLYIDTCMWQRLGEIAGTLTVTSTRALERLLPDPAEEG